MVYDCFMFFNELDLLKVRLAYMYDHVDYFIITECVNTFSNFMNQKKPMWFKENEHIFSDWSDKIIYNPIYDVPLNFSERTTDIYTNKILDICAKYNHYPHSRWEYDNETYQRECILTKLNSLNLNDQDIIISSDLDEIPDARLLKNINVPPDNHINLNMKSYAYYINVIKNETWTGGTKIFRWNYVKDLNIGLCGLRMNNSGIRPNKFLGWHFSYLGGVESIKKKIAASGHYEYNNDTIINKIEHNINNNQDLYARPNHNMIDDDMSDIDERLIYLFNKYYPQSIKKEAI